MPSATGNKERSERNAVFGDRGPTPSQAAADIGSDIPVERVPLPSKGLVYPEGSPLHLAEAVDIRAMTAREEDILTSRALIKRGTVITELIRSCLVDKSIDVGSMLSGDRNAVMVALRITGYGSGYSVGVDCPACSEHGKHEFDLGQLEIKPLGLQPAEPGANAFDLKLPMSGKLVRFKFLTGADEEEVLRQAEAKRKAGMQVDNLVTSRLQFHLVAVDGKSDRGEIIKFIRSMPARDSLTLRKHIAQHEPGIDMKASIDCQACGARSEVQMPLGASFFWPEA